MYHHFLVGFFQEAAAAGWGSEGAGRLQILTLPPQAIVFPTNNTFSATVCLLLRKRTRALKVSGFLTCKFQVQQLVPTAHQLLPNNRSTLYAAFPQITLLGAAWKAKTAWPIHSSCTKWWLASAGWVDPITSQQWSAVAHWLENPLLCLHAWVTQP